MSEASPPATMRELEDLVLKKREAWISRVVYRKFSVPMTYVLLRTPVTPNQVTWAGGFVGLVALAALGNPWERFWLRLSGLFLFQVAIVLDHVDGELARAKRMGSPGGAFLDGFVMEILLHLGLAATIPILVYNDTGDSRWLAVGAAFFFLKAADLATFLHRGMSTLRTPSARLAPGASVRAGRPLRQLVAERWWEVKKMANATLLLILLDLGLADRGLVPINARGIAWNLLALYLTLGVAVVAISLSRSAWQGSRGRFGVDLDPYK